MSVRAPGHAARRAHGHHPSASNKLLELAGRGHRDDTGIRKRGRLMSHAAFNILHKFRDGS